MKKFIRKHLLSIMFSVVCLIAFFYGIFWNDYQVDVFAFMFISCFLVAFVYDKEKEDDRK